MNRHGSLNHIFRLVWSRASERWIPVAETMRASGKGSKRLLVAVTLSMSVGVVEAGPLGGQVVSGNGTIAQSGTTTTITQGSQNLLLNWKSFNIAPQETVDFVQPSATSIAVNRIFDINGTQILGHLNANGQVYLINPNGILFGRGAQVDVGGLVASTLDVKDPTSGADTKTFAGPGSGSVVNDGTITAGSGGYVALLGNKVSNHGAISTQLGSVVLGAGSGATLTFAGNHLLHMQVDQGVLDSLAENSGLIRADGGQVVMTAGAKDTLLASVVNNSGVIEANTVDERGGSILLMGGTKAGQILVTGTLEASSATAQGGDIGVTASSITIGEGARVEATGANGGGSIAIGGGWQGGGDMAQATTVYVSKGATLDASAVGSGNGGVVVVRSHVEDARSATRVYGTLLARGGSGGGDGGHIETSGHYLDVSDSVVDASGKAGRAGEWLLDPYNVIIGSSVSGNAYSAPNFSPTSSDSTILASAISTALSGGSNVTITTGSSGASLGDITVSAAITKTAGATTTLTLQAADSIIINQPIVNTSATGFLNVNLWADNDSGTHDGVGVVILNNGITTKGGALAFGTNTAQMINGVSTLVGGDVYAGGTSAVTLSTGGGSIGIYGQLIVANAGGFNLNSANGDVTFGGLVDSGDAYTYVSSTGISWTAALSAAKSGLGANAGDTYLATITSRLENAVASASASYHTSWLGARRVTGLGTDAVWRWVTGPEGLQNSGQGLPFFTQNGTATTNGNGGSAIGAAYTNWNSGEPNNSSGTGLSAGRSSEYVMQFVGNQGQWNDLAPTSTAVGGYVMETNLAPSPLNVNAGTGVVTFASAIGSNKSLSTLSVSATTIALPSPPTVNTTGAQTFTGQVTVGGGNVNVLTVSADNLVTTYGSGTPALSTSYSGFVNGNTVASLTSPATETTTATAQPNAGSYPITPSGVVDSNYYILYNPGTLIVNVAPLTITASSASRTYGAANPALTVSNSGFQYNDTASILTTPATASTIATLTSNASSYATTAAGAVTSSGNYAIAYIPGTLSVSPAPLTLTGLTGTSRVYNGLTTDSLAGTGTLAGLRNGETLTLGNASSATLANAGAGSQGVTSAITLGNGTGLASNYTLTQPSLANVTISQAPLTLTGLSGTARIYNGLNTDILSGTGTLVGLQNGETLTLANAANATLGSANAGSESVTSAITLGNGTGFASNYTLTQPVLANVTISQAPLTLTGLSGSSRIYNGLTTDALSGAGILVGLQNGETLTLANAASGTLGSANAGSESVTSAITLGDGTGLASNYTLTQPSLANVIVAQAPLTLSGLTGTSRVYNGLTTDALSGTGTLLGLQNGETLTLANAASATLASPDAGSQGVTSAITLSNGTGLASNYTLTQPALANVTISQASLTLTGLSGTARAYNGLTTDSLSGTGTLVGLQNGESLTLANAASGTLGSANAGSQGVTSAITLSDGTGLASNYALAQPTLANVTISQAPLTLIGLSGTSRAYNGLTTDSLSGTGTLFGLQNGESLTLANAASGTLGSANAGSQGVTSAITLSDGTGLASNYTLTQPLLANVTISQAPLTLSGLAGTSRAYNGLTTDGLTGTGTLSGLQNGETLTFANAANGTLGSADAGSEGVTSAITLSNGTGLASNYTLTQPSLANVTIAPAPVTLTGLSGTGRVYNGLTTDVLSGTGTLAGLQNGETLTLANAASGTLGSANAGSESVTSAITLSNGTGLASNYSLTQPSLANVTISQAPLTLTGTVANDKVYDGTTTAALMSGSLNGVVAGEAVTLIETGIFASKHVGNAIAVTAADTLSGAAASNYYLIQPAGLSASITPKELGLTLSGDPTRVYDGTTSFGFTGYSSALSGVISGDAVSVGTGSVTGYGDKNVGANKIVTFAGFALTGPNADDYQLASGAATSTASITPATISNVIGITALSKVYDGGTSATLNSGGALFTGELAGDSLTVATALGAFAGKNVATGSLVNISGITLGGTDALNYVLGDTNASTRASITQLAAVVWIGPASGGNWSDPGNWAGGAIPDLSNVANVVIPAGDTVRFDSSVAGPVNLSNLNLGGLLIAGGTLNVANALNLTNYSQSGGTVGGPGSFTVVGDFKQTAGQISMGPGSVTVTQTSGDLSFADISGGGVSLISTAGNLTLGTLFSSANLAVTALGGGISQSAGASLAVAGTTVLQATLDGVPANITLTNAGNALGSTVNVSGANVGLTNAGPLTFGSLLASGNLTLASVGALDLGSSTVGGNLSASSANGDVIQSGPLRVAGTTNIVAGSGSVRLTNPSNVLNGEVTTSAVNVTVAGAQLKSAVDPLLANVLSQLESSLLPPGGAAVLSQTFEEDISARSDASAAEDGFPTDVTVSVGSSGPALRIVNGGVHLPARAAVLND